MRSSSLKVYSPVEYTGYKEKEAATRRNREAAQAIEKPRESLSLFYTGCAVLQAPELERDRRAGSHHSGDRVRSARRRGYVLRTHPNKTAPITTSSPAAEESQPYVFTTRTGKP